MYTVVAQRQILAPVEKVWDYLTKPELLAKWFADTSHFAPDAPVYLETGAGDFFSGRVIEWVDELHEHFVSPAVVREGRYVVPEAAGYSVEMLPGSLARYSFPHGAVWRALASHGGGMR